MGLLLLTKELKLGGGRDGQESEKIVRHVGKVAIAVARKEVIKVRYFFKVKVGGMV